MAKPKDWRDRAAADLAAQAIRRLRPSGRAAMLVGERLDLPEEALTDEDAVVVRWDRRAYAGRPATLRPDPGPHDLILLRLPRSKLELEMTAHMLTAVASQDAELLLYGAKDEGIGSAPGRLDDLCGALEVLAVGGHCRVWRMKLRVDFAEPPRTEPADWAVTFDPAVEGLSSSWTSFPGVFAHGELDPGTRLLAETLLAAQPAQRVLDFACGTGVLGALHGASDTGVELDLIDHDAFAIRACELNVPAATALVSDGLSAVEGRTYDRIVTNPPIHIGKAETRAIVSELIRSAPGLLSKKGSLWLVIQKRFALGRELDESFRDVSVRAENDAFRVWEARRPIRRRRSS